MQLFPTSTSIPTMYELPKMHKDGVPLCPIPSIVGCFNHAFAKWKGGKRSLSRETHFLWNIIHYDRFSRVSEWMSNHYLLLNPTKTELIVFGSPIMLSSLKIHGVLLPGGVCIRLSPVVKNLGFSLDSTMSFKTQAANVKSTCFHKLRNIAKMKSFLTVKQLKMLTQAIDYCNSLYFG